MRRFHAFFSIILSLLICRASFAQSPGEASPDSKVLTLEDHVAYFQTNQLYGVFEPANDGKGTFYFTDRAWIQSDTGLEMVESSERFAAAKVSSVFGAPVYLKSKTNVYDAKSVWHDDSKELVWSSGEGKFVLGRVVVETWWSDNSAPRVLEGDELRSSTVMDHKGEIEGFSTLKMQCSFVELEHYEVACRYKYLPMGARSLLYFWRVEEVSS